ncbi:MAG: hypothetical protein ACTHMC_17660 [Pseudobacter sp.]|uniref:hypothetical protein n=1 Tax=Pseudobacter sp. TaxID=2045420 RepID=UPI003F820188
MSKNMEYTSLSLPAKFIGNPMKYVADFFYYNWKYQALDTLHEHFMALLKPKRRKKLIKRGSDQLFYVETLSKLLEAMWLVWQEDKEQKKGAIPDELQDSMFLFDKHFFIRETERNHWRAMPRYLCEEEFFIPMISVDLFFKRHSLSKWKDLLNEVLHNILGTGVGDFGNDYTNPYEVHFSLACLIEASYLIHIRQQDYFINYISALKGATSPLPNLHPDESNHNKEPNNEAINFESAGIPHPSPETT